MYAESFLNLLKDKPLEGYFINEYMLNDELLNIMPFSNGAVATNANGLAYTVVRNTEFETYGREFGSDYESSNDFAPTNETFYLSVAGAPYSVDVMLEEVTRKRTIAEQQKLAYNATVKNFAKRWTKGFVDYATTNSLTLANTIELSTVTKDSAIAFMNWFNEIVMAELNVDANTIICSRKMAAKLKSVERIVNNYVEKYEFGKIKYNTFNGLRVVALDECDLTADGVESLLVCKLSEEDISCGSPADKGSFVKVVTPDMSMTNGSPIQKGFVEMPMVFLPKNRKAMILAKVDTNIA